MSGSDQNHCPDDRSQDAGSRRRDGVGAGAGRGAGASRDDPLLRFRPEFPILDRCAYLVSHSLGAMPKGAREGLDRYGREWDERGVRAWAEGWWELPVRVGDSVARLLGAPAGSVSMQPNVTLASALFLSCCDFTGARNRIVTDALNFPSLLYLLRQWGRLTGGGDRTGGSGSAGSAELKVVPSSDGLTVDAQRLAEAIDARTRVVAISHVLFRSSFIQDLPTILDRARRMGAWVLLDVYQSAGVVPTDLTELGVEAAVGGCLKWLCGGPGTAFLYIRPDLAGGLEPKLTGWQSHQDPFAFDPKLRRADGAWRFLHGTPAVPSLRAAEAGLEIVRRAGIEAIRSKSLRQTGLILERAAREGWAVSTPPRAHQRGGVVSVDPPHAYEVSRALLAREVLVDYRPGGGIRLGPHFYNSDEEVESALDAIAVILDDGTWRNFEGTERDRVT